MKEKLQESLIPSVTELLGRREASLRTFDRSEALHPVLRFCTNCLALQLSFPCQYTGDNNYIFRTALTGGCMTESMVRDYHGI